MILTQTVVKYIPIPEGTKFVNATVYDYKTEFNEETGLEVVTISRRKTMVNLSLVSELEPTVLKASKTQWLKTTWNEWRSSASRGLFGAFRDSGWARPKDIQDNVTETVNVFKLTKLHKDVNLDAIWLTIDEVA